ncbi:MAG: RtcB family protein [Candidatus Micrarchaeota archaeon]
MVPFKQIAPAVWEIQKTGLMRVPARIYASEKIVMSMVSDRTMGQLANVAALPGIVSQAALMPDGHEGYGFPIGGVAAFDPENGGVVSPGGVGYDINCTDGDAKVTLEHGAYLKIKDIEQNLGENRAKFAELNTSVGKTKSADILYFMKRAENSFIYEITTKSGNCLRVTGDHPVYTKNGMKKTCELGTEDQLAICAFEGAPYGEPPGELIVDEKAIDDVLLSKRSHQGGNGGAQVMKCLKEQKLLPLTISNAKLPYLAKIAGFIFGDGSISFVGGRKGSVCFFGKEEDLETIAQDIRRIGFSPCLSKRVRRHKIATHYKKYEFVRVECSLKVNSTAFASLLVALGVPSGVKTSQHYSVPSWLFKAPLWIKRLFLAAFFGADMSAPATLNKYNFYAPTLGMNKLESMEANAIEFLNQIKELLGDFDIETCPIMKVEGYRLSGKRGTSCGYRIQVLATPENLIKFFETVSFEYNLKKFKDACLAANYVQLKDRVTALRNGVRKKAMAIYAGGAAPADIYRQLASAHTPEQFIKHSIWTKFKGGPRVAFNFMSFSEYKERFAFGDSGLAWDEIESIEKVPFNNMVYDITIADESHNFFANGILVSNCGVRLLATGLTEADIAPKKRELVDKLFANVPSGVGSKGKLRLTESELEDAVTQGVPWAVEKGYGRREDIEACEEHGCIPDARFANISPMARKRGLPQFGTVGAGNHFVEVQKVEKVLDQKTAKSFGLWPGQVVVMIHSGSRGFGHQICTDHLQMMIQAAGKYNIPLPDRELCCAPLGSPEAEHYLGAMRCAVNFAFNNRHIMMHWVRQTFDSVLGRNVSDDMPLVYDVCHNIAKFEEHDVDGQRKRLCVHRKGATRAFAAGRPELSGKYRSIGQPVIIPGSMGTASYVLLGLPGSMKNTFGSTCHGAGRQMSRSRAMHTWKGEDIQKNLGARNILVKATDSELIAEEAPGAYKDVDEVVRSVELAGLSSIVARMVPLAVVKG